MKKNALMVVLSLGAMLLSGVHDADAARVIVGPRGHVRAVVHTGFPIHRVLPEVYVVPGAVVRVAPRAYLAPVVFRPVTVVLPAPSARVWSGTQTLERREGWTDFTMNVDQRGNRLLLDIARGAAQISFAEVVFENGETQVIDFNDGVHRMGTYSLLDIPRDRSIDHVRVVAKADTPRSVINLHVAS